MDLGINFSQLLAKMSFSNEDKEPIFSGRLSLCPYETFRIKPKVFIFLLLLLW